jgi:hypothetical protein
MRKIRTIIIPFEAMRIRNESFILIRVPIRTIQLDKWCQAATIYSGFHLVKNCNGIEKLAITGDPLMPRCKGGIGQKNDFDLFGSHIM